MKLIDRDKALSFPFANGQYDHEHADTHFILGCEAYREWLEGLPVVEPERKKGTWEQYEEEVFKVIFPLYRCTVCGAEPLVVKTPYCPYCGSKMEK